MSRPEKAGPYAADTTVKRSAQDRFRRWPFAQRVGRVIATRSDPASIVVGVYGAWGEGKTTVLNFIEEELAAHQHVVCLRFNPWRFPEELRLIREFFRSLMQTLGRKLETRKEQLGDLLGKLSGPASLAGAGDAVKAVGDLLSTVELEDLKGRVEEALRAEGKRVVVLMDDIDRLDKYEIQSVFRLVKLAADFDHTAYVLAFDSDMVASALQERYSAGDEEAGRNFLEKIVQVPLDLPKIPRHSLSLFCQPLVEQAFDEAGIQLSEAEVQRFGINFMRGLEVRLRTPRVAKRYGNILSFSLPILRGEVDPVDLALLEGIRVFYPGLYDTIRDNPDIFLGGRESTSSGSWDQAGDPGRVRRGDGGPVGGRERGSREPRPRALPPKRGSFRRHRSRRWVRADMGQGQADRLTRLFPKIVLLRHSRRRNL